MLLSQFEDCSPTEESCMLYFRDVRIDQDISCPIVGEKLISSRPLKMFYLLLFSYLINKSI